MWKNFRCKLQRHLMKSPLLLYNHWHAVMFHFSTKSYLFHEYLCPLVLDGQWQCQMLHKSTEPHVNCNGDDDCCKSTTRNCYLGEGDCDSDNECANGYICGENNCRTVTDSHNVSFFVQFCSILPQYNTRYVA